MQFLSKSVTRATETNVVLSGAKLTASWTLIINLVHLVNSFLSASVFLGPPLYNNPYLLLLRVPGTFQESTIMTRYPSTNSFMVNSPSPSLSRLSKMSFARAFALCLLTWQEKIHFRVAKCYGYICVKIVNIWACFMDVKVKFHNLLCVTALTFCFGLESLDGSFRVMQTTIGGCTFHYVTRANIFLALLTHFSDWRFFYIFQNCSKFECASIVLLEPAAAKLFCHWHKLAETSSSLKCKVDCLKYWEKG